MMLEAAIRHSEQIRELMFSVCLSGLLSAFCFRFFKRRKSRRKASPFWWALGCFVLFVSFFVYLAYGY